MQAELEVRRRMMTHPEQAEIYVELADLQVARGATDEAVSTLVGSGNRFISSGEPKKAVLLMTKATDLKPDDPELQFLLGKAHTQNRDFEAAEGPLRRALELGSEDPSVLVFLGAVLWESGRMAEAEPVYRQAIDATGRAFMPLSQLGRLLLWQGQYEEATALLREATQRNPRDVGTLFDLGEALRGSNQVEEAIAVYRRVLAVAPEFKRARYGLAMMLARQGDREASQAELEIYNRLIVEAEESNRLAEIEIGGGGPSRPDDPRGASGGGDRSSRGPRGDRRSAVGESPSLPSCWQARQCSRESAARRGTRSEPPGRPSDADQHSHGEGPISMSRRHYRMIRPWLGMMAAVVALGSASVPGSAQDACRGTAFSEAAEEVGIEFVHDRGETGNFYNPETMGSGVAFFDYDGDGWQDCYLVQSGLSSASGG